MPRIPTPRATALLGLLAVVSLSGPAGAATLYDGAGLPAGQSWLTYFATGGTQTAVGTDPVTVDTTANSGFYAGYLNRSINLFPAGLGGFVNADFPALDRNPGFVLDFTVRINAETSTRPERAGFSVLVLSSDRYGIELGFHTGGIFAQDRDFTAADLATRTAAFDTTRTTSYRLSVAGDAYALAGGGTPILSGSLVDYFNTASTSPLGFVYGQPDLLFIGDDTTSANASFTLGAVQVNAIPLPAAAWLLLGGLAALGRVSNRLDRRPHGHAAAALRERVSPSERRSCAALASASSPKCR
jgi:hypothetical protein